MRRGSVAVRRGSRRSLRRSVLPFCLAAALPSLIAACQPYTTRPSFGPLPAAEEAVVDLDVSKATTLLAEALTADSIPVSRIEPQDGYLETPWFNASTGTPSTERPLGDSLVRVRGWVNAYGKERGSIRAETAVRPLANPSLPSRELDQQAPPDNPAAVRVARVLAHLARRYPVPGATPPVAPAAVTPGDSTTKPASIDSTLQKPIQKPPR
jgi:hypothetical protein